VDEVAFGRYRLLSLIGEGGMGKVYRAHDTVIGRDVAIKVLPIELGAEPAYRARFKREAHTAARLSEPHIVPIFDTGEFDDQLYLVMPIIDGVDVHGLLQRDGPMRPPRAVHVIEQLGAALDAAHAAGLVHRDVKPSNALVTARDFVYLIDFGIARWGGHAVDQHRDDGGHLGVYGTGTVYRRGGRCPFGCVCAGVRVARVPDRKSTVSGQQPRAADRRAFDAGSAPAQ
jgi:serine/threonine protein kinase